MENKLVPKLRFPEFRNNFSWESITLNKYGKTISGLSGKSGDDFGVGKPYITYMQVFNNTCEDISKHGKVLIGDEEKQNPVHLGDILLTTSSETPDEVGFASVILNEPSELTYLNSFCFVFRIDDLYLFYPLYLSYLFRSQLYRKSISILAQGSTRFNISKGSFLNLKIQTTLNLKEQQKIADCLSSLDNLITAENEKLDALKNHKKGLMQNLFPAEGEKAPKLRFPEFKDSGEWEEKKLEGLAKRGSGHTPNKQMPNYYDGGIKWVSLADSKKLDNGYIYTTKIQISKEGIENSSAVLHPAGTVILSRDAGVGKSAILHSEMAVSQHFIVWACDELKLSKWYLYYVFQILKPIFESIAVGSTIKTIGLPYFKELLIKVPSIN